MNTNTKAGDPMKSAPANTNEENRTPTANEKQAVDTWIENSIRWLRAEQAYCDTQYLATRWHDLSEWWGRCWRRPTAVNLAALGRRLDAMLEALQLLRGDVAAAGRSS